LKKQNPQDKPQVATGTACTCRIWELNLENAEKVKYNFLYGKTRLQAKDLVP